MNTEIINLKEVSLNNIVIPKHPCMPDVVNIQEETWGVVDNHTLRAVCSLWTDKVPGFENYHTGIIGNFFAESDAAGVLLLRYVSEKLKEREFNYVIGPMNGDTWHSYRLVDSMRDHPPFFMEYYTPETWPDIFTSAGFKEIANYRSAKAMSVDYEDDSAREFENRIAELELTIRSFDISQAEAELTAMYSLSLQSFSRNFLYTDISLPEFLKLYQKIVSIIDSDFVLLAEHKGKLVGYIFAVPDYLQKQRGETMDSVIIKTVARDPDPAYAGLGNYLMYKIHSLAGERGFKSVIHAYMYDSNAAIRTISDKSAQTIRKYVLYGKRLVL